jgi:hypothetical protein
MAYTVTQQEPDEQQAPGNADEVEPVPSAGDLLEASVAHADEVGTFAGRDEPAELSYDYVEGDRRAMDVLRHVVESEGGELDPQLESSGPVLPGEDNGRNKTQSRTPPPGRRSWHVGSLFRRFRH